MQLVTNSLKYLSPIATIELSNHKGSAEEATNMTDRVIICVALEIKKNQKTIGINGEIGKETNRV